MSRLIDVDAFCKECIEKLYMLSCDGCAIKYYKFHAAIEAEPVRHGEWLPYPSDQYRKCSVCGIEYAKFEMLLKHKYCPNCGAKMDGKEKME